MGSLGFNPPLVPIVTLAQGMGGVVIPGPFSPATLHVLDEVLVQIGYFTHPPSDGTARPSPSSGRTANIEQQEREAVNTRRPFITEPPALYWSARSMAPRAHGTVYVEDPHHPGVLVAIQRAARAYTPADGWARVVVHSAALAAGFVKGAQFLDWWRRIDETGLRLYLVHLVLTDCRLRFQTPCFEHFMEERMLVFDQAFDYMKATCQHVWVDEAAFREAAYRLAMAAVALTFLPDDCTEEWPADEMPERIELADLGVYGEPVSQHYAAQDVGARGDAPAGMGLATQ
ncbi:hypothetical protein Q8F55_000090 [Vanrija albida]|uniref:Uncharacterized protein n=1 Tax=Vanrija albida TaxID=181172 RepID=A0ABR3QC86_9TREE